MTWLQRYRVRHDVANAIWILPLLSIVAGIGAVHCFHWIEAAMGWEFGLPPGTAGAVLLPHRLLSIGDDAHILSLA